MTPKTCGKCGTTFAKRPKETWAAWDGRRYCSRACSNRATSSTTPVIDRILARLDSSDPESCWIWPGATTPDGRYGVVGITTGRVGLTHVQMLGRPVPPGWQVDHLCRVTLCCNPAHLEAVTQAENLRRQQAAITHCLRGHEFTPENTYHPPATPTRRQCRSCNRIRNRNGYHARKALR